MKNSSSRQVIDAYNKLQALKAPTYENQYETDLNNMYQQILNRPGFKYDINQDALYQQYKDQYLQAGKTAMQDTIAQAASMTGGYGNSYAQTAGQQAYQNYLSELNNMVPTLANMAYERYQDEGNEMRSNYNMIKGRYDDTYDKYRDEVSDYQSERNFLQNNYENERNFDYNKFADNRDLEYKKWESDRDYGYQQWLNERNHAYQKYLDQRDWDWSYYKFMLGLQ